jgi:hypothetical protein
LSAKIPNVWRKLARGDQSYRSTISFATASHLLANEKPGVARLSNFSKADFDDR